jgi:predicted GNAT family N-acyltransferase
LDKPAQYLRERLSINALKRVAGAISDTDAALRMQRAKTKLFAKFGYSAYAQAPGKRAEEMAIPSASAALMN